MRLSTPVFAFADPLNPLCHHTMNRHTQSASPSRLLWDVFCRVIDNHGDLGVLWRLSCQLAERGHTVRLWVDEPAALTWMAPDGHRGVTVHAWADSTRPEGVASLPFADVWVEGFGCEIDEYFIAHFLCHESDERQRTSYFHHWFNLEYLTAETYAARCHGLPSPVMSGPAKGWTKQFFYPGFTPATGGLLRESDLAQRRQHFDRQSWLSRQGIRWQGERLISLFSYEPPGLVTLLDRLAEAPQPVRLLVTHGRAAAAVHAAANQLGWSGRQSGKLMLTTLPALTQTDFDHLLWSCDLNFVRGEDSLVRALWARAPFVWQIYPQSDDAHFPKLEAFLDWAQAPDDIRALHHWWNSCPQPPHGKPCNLSVAASDLLTGRQDACAAQAWVQALADQACQQPDLVTQLIDRVANNAGARTIDEKGDPAC